MAVKKTLTPKPTNGVKKSPAANPATSLVTVPASQPPSPPPPSTQPPSLPPVWTIMVYIAADAVLANFGIESLKQLNEAIGNLYATTANKDVVVAATLSIDAPAGQPIPRFIFNECSGSNLGQSLKLTFPAPSNMTEEESLASFLTWVYSQDECKNSKNFALILWSHGPELFLQPPPGIPTGASGSFYLTPVELRNALESPPA